jgi:hypothetical protein
MADEDREDGFELGGWGLRSHSRLALPESGRDFPARGSTDNAHAVPHDGPAGITNASPLGVNSGQQVR